MASQIAKTKLGYAWLVWSLGALFYFYGTLLQVSPGVMVPELMQAFKVKASSLGYLSAFYFYAYAGMQIPVGLLLDHYGPRRLLAAAAGICMVGCLAFGYADNLWHAAMGRFLIGFGSAFAAVGCMKFASSWFPLQRFSLLTGLLITLGMLGAVGGATPLALLINLTSWRNSMILLGVVGGALAIIIWWVIRDAVTLTQVVSHKSSYSNKGLKRIVTNSQNWLIAIYGGLVFAPTTAFGALWGVPFLNAKYGIDRPVAAGMISLLFIGWAVGSPVTGWVSDYLKRRRPTMLIGSIGALITMLCIIYLQLSPPIMSVLLFCFGFFSSGFLAAFSIIREINSEANNATALGFMNMINMLGGVILQPLIGYFLDYYWIGKTMANARIYMIDNYHLSLAILPGILFISVLLVPLITETYCKSLDIK